MMAESSSWIVSTEDAPGDWEAECGLFEESFRNTSPKLESGLETAEVLVLFKGLGMSGLETGSTGLGL